MRRVRNVALLLVLALAGVSAAAALASKATTLRPSTDITPYTASTLTPYTASTISSTTSRTTTRPRGANPAKPLGWFFGLWGTWVPGGVWEGAGYIWFSTGAKGHALQISGNHTWSWHGLRGTWRNGDSEYPIVLLHALDGHDWKVGTAPSYVHAAQITIWDGFTYYYAKRAKR